MKKIKNISIIGSGNVGCHLAKSFFNKGYPVRQIYSRSIENAKNMAQNIDASPINSLGALQNNIDFLIVAVHDDAIEEVIKQIPFRDVLITHTSGSVSMDVFAQYSFRDYGILYPLQSFNKNKKINLKKVPFCLEANNSSSLASIKTLARSISNYVYEIDSKERETLHLAAVFVNNFSNYMYQIAKDITDKNDLPFEILKPLIYETAKKMKSLSPKDAQTGPAKRNDLKTMKKHLDQLQDSPKIKELYKNISELIIKSANQTN